MFNLPVCSGVRYGSLVDVDVIFIVELEELLADELRVVVRDNGVWDCKVIDNVEEE